MDALDDYFITLLAQFAGGPGPAENNLVRFGLAATMWGALFVAAWSRLRQHDRPRERLLLAGFGLAFLRDFFMFAHLSLRTINGSEHDLLCMVTVPMEHALTLAAVVVIAGAFLRYILDDADLAGRYLRTGLVLTGIVTGATLLWWPQQLMTDPTVRFHETWPAWLLHTLACVLIVVAVAVLVRKRGWLRNVVVLALSLLFCAEALVLLNLLTDRAYSTLLCPLGNTFYLWAIPAFGYVYYREQANEKLAAETALRAYRDHLEELVDARTAALTEANKHAAAMEERQRLAADMHDGLAQTLSYLGLATDRAEDFLTSGRTGDAGRELERVQDALMQATSDVRRTISSLQRQTPPRRSLQESLEQMVIGSDPGSQPAVTLVDHLYGPLLMQAEESEQVVRVAQEAVTNARRHGGATHIRVELGRDAQHYSLAIVDDGCGFVPRIPPDDDHDHFGLSIMEARATRIDGELAVESQPGCGTRVTLTWPRAPARRHHDRTVLPPTPSAT